MEKHRSVFFLTLILVATAISAGLVFWSSNKIKEGTSPLESFASGNTKQISETETQEDILAPNGKMTLIVKNIKKENSTSQTFFTKIDKDDTPIQIYSADLGPDKLISIPYNSFSPNNKFIYLKVGISGKPEYIVLRSDGKNIKDDEKTVEITGPFYEKYTEFVITDVTGWGGDGLIVINSNFIDGKTGPSFWFDLSNFSFIKLSTKFN